MLPDITSQKVAIPAALFLALSPGVLLTADGKRFNIGARNTNQMAVFFHSLVFFLVYSLVAKAMGLVLTKTDLLVTTSLFLALSPVLLLTIPPGSGGLFDPVRPVWLRRSHTPWFSRSSLRFCVANFLNTTK